MKKARYKSGLFKNLGVTDGARTHDNRNHNPGLYQLSYGHHCERKMILAHFFKGAPIAWSTPFGCLLAMAARCIVDTHRFVRI